jgi:protein gp37
MADNTKIRWADATWNAWYGCQKVSQGCKHCYAERDMTRYGKDFRAVTRAAKATFDAPLKWARNGKVKPGSRIFTCSWSDWFIEDADEWRDEAWQIVRDTPFAYMILTKRPERMAEHLPSDWGAGYPNVWLGVSAENQENTDKRIPQLLKIPAAIHFVSAEPLLGPLNLYDFLPALWPKWTPETEWKPAVLFKIDWVITGGESGPGCRPAEMDWFRDIRDQCTSAGVAFFHKQMGGKRKVDGEWGGYLLDGKEWSEFPEVVTA